MISGPENVVRVKSPLHSKHEVGHHRRRDPRQKPCHRKTPRVRTTNKTQTKTGVRSISAVKQVTTSKRSRGTYVQAITMRDTGRRVRRERLPFAAHNVHPQEDVDLFTPLALSIGDPYILFFSSLRRFPPTMASASSSLHL